MSRERYQRTHPPERSSDLEGLRPGQLGRADDGSAVVCHEHARRPALSAKATYGGVSSIAPPQCLLHAAKQAILGAPTWDGRMVDLKRRALLPSVDKHPRVNAVAVQLHHRRGLALQHCQVVQQQLAQRTSQASKPR